MNVAPSVAASWERGGDVWFWEADGKWKPPGFAEAASGEAGGPVEMILSSGAGGPGPGEGGGLLREALRPSSSRSLGWLHSLKSGLRRPPLWLGKGGGRSGPQGVLHFSGGRARSLRRLGVKIRVGRSLETRQPGRLRRLRTGLPGKSGSSGSSEAKDCDGSPLLVSLLALLKKRCRFCGGNHCAAARPGRRRGLPPPAAPYVRKSRIPDLGSDAAMADTRQTVQMQTPRDFRVVR